MDQISTAIALKSRAVVTVRGPDWRGFLQNLLTHDVETLSLGEARFCALLTPQGRLLYDLFVIPQEDGALIDVEAAWCDGLIQRLGLYKLRAKVEIATSDISVSAVPPAGNKGTQYLIRPEGPSLTEGPKSELSIASPYFPDPRLPALGQRLYGIEAPLPETAYDAHRLALGVPGPADWGTDKTYPIEADFDLLKGIDFQKGCFVGQETTSRMKRRGAIKSRMLPIDYAGAQIPPGTEILAGTLRAGEVLSGMDGRSMALVRLDRIEDAALTADGRAVRVSRPAWMD